MPGVNIDLDTPFQIGNTRHMAPLRDMLAFGSGAQTQVFEGVAAGQTHVTVQSVPLNMAANLGWIVLKPYTVQCQIRKVTGINGNDLTLSDALTYELDAGDAAIWVDQPTVSVNWFGAKGDGVTDDTASIQAAIDQGVLLSNVYGQNRYGRMCVLLHQGSIYRTTAPIDLCEKQGILIDGGAPNFGAMILCEATGKAAIELIGSQNITIQNLQIYGHASNTPSVGIFVSRSTGTGGSNAKRNFLKSVYFSGYYANTSAYVLDVDSFGFSECNFEPVTAGDAVVYLAKDNDLSLTPDNATLLGVGYGMYGPWFYNCHFSSSADATTLYCGVVGGVGLALRDCYIYGNSATHPTIVFEGQGHPTLENILFEGIPGTRILFKYKSGAVNYFGGSFRNISWGASVNYVIYADDSTELRTVLFDGYNQHSAYGGAYTPMSIYAAYLCDFSGLGYYYQGGAFNITVRYSARGCHFVLGPDDTVTFSATHIGNIIEYRADAAASTYWEFESGMLKTGGYTWNGGHLMMGIYHLWIDATGDLRLKSSAPTSDTDGTIVGTQS